MTEARVTATYEIETAFPLQQAAETMAGEQSTGPFVRGAGGTAALRAAQAARQGPGGGRGAAARAG